MFRFVLGFFAGVAFTMWLSSGRMGTRRPMTATEEKLRQLRQRYDWLRQFTDEELRDISFCDEGVTLQPGQQYFDLNHPERGVITARRGERVGAGSCLVSRESVSDSAWQKLIEYGAARRRRVA